MYSAAIQRYFNEHIHLPYSFFLQPQRFIRHALKKKGAFMATAYNYVEPSEADNEDIIEYLATDFNVMAGNGWPALRFNEASRAHDASAL